MCGFAGILSFDGQQPDRALLRAMNESIRHRGPDDEGLELDGSFGVAHRRLSILDLSDVAHQPMWDAKRQALLAYNGEIYNFRDIRERLRTQGVDVRSTGDTEVLLNACVTFGVGRALPLLNGMFAFAFWEAKDEALYLARDRMGIKPLYYWRDKGRVIFASEIKAILCAVAAKPNRVALNAIMAGDALWDPQTLFEGVFAVQPGEMIRFGPNGAQSSQRFFNLADEVNAHEYRGLERLSLEEVSRYLEVALRNSVDLHTISDVPVAVLASGGLDSSLIAVLSSDDQPLPLYHANVVGPASELEAARELSQALNAQLHVADLTPQRYAADMAEVTYHHETPSAYHPNDLPFHLICRLARDHGVKVLLTGEGADELFLGYPWMIVSDTRRRMQQATRTWARRLAWLPGVNGFVKAIGKLSGNGSAELLAAEEYVARQQAEQAYAFIEHPAERQAAVDSFVSCGAHLRSLLYRNDRMGMMESLESRIPFLENNLIRMAVNLPARHKLRSSALGFLARHPYSSNKLALRKVARRLLPRSLADRRKLGFPVDARSYFNIQPAFFEQGFLVDHYQLTSPQLAAVLEQAGADTVWRFFATEVFARIFYLGQDRTQVAENIAACAVESGAAAATS